MYFFIAAGQLARNRSNPAVSPPTLRVLANRVRFGVGSSVVVVVSNQRLATPPVLAGFTFLSGSAAGGAWHYRYAKADVMAPLSGELVGISQENAFTVTSPAVNERGLTQSLIQGGYQLYGWHGTLQVSFLEPYVLIAPLDAWQRHALTDTGSVLATSDGTDSPDWVLCDGAGSPASAPTATHIKLTDPELMNASGSLDLFLTTP